MTRDAIEYIARHVVETRFGDLPKEAVDASQKFILDSIGVGLAGGRGPWVEELINAQGPAPAATLCLGSLQPVPRLLWQHAATSAGTVPANAGLGHPAGACLWLCRG